MERAKFHPAVKESTLLEVSRIVLASLFVTTISGLLLFLPLWHPLTRALLASSDPILDWPILVAAAITSALSCGLCMIGAVLKWPGEHPIVGAKVWQLAIVNWRPKGSKQTELIVELSDGTIWRGTFASFDSDPEESNRSLALKAPLKRKRPGSADFTPISDSWKVVVLPESEIRSFQVAYPRVNTEVY